MGCQEGSSGGDTILSGGKMRNTRGLNCAGIAQRKMRNTPGAYIANALRKARAKRALALRLHCASCWPDRPYGPCRPIAHLVWLGVA